MQVRRAPAKWSILFGMRPQQHLRLADLFVALADTLVAGYDVLDSLTKLAEGCVELLGVSAAGVLLADPHGRLRTAAASNETVRLLELFQLQTDQGPCPESFRTGRTVHSPDLALDSDRWPELVQHAMRNGYRAVHAHPLRLHNQTIGALNLFSADTGPMPDADLHVAGALGKVATISVLRERALAGHAELAGQLQTALDSRVLVEQAKGILAERRGVEPGQAFAVLRSHARSHNRRLTEVAGEVVAGNLDPTVDT